MIEQAIRDYVALEDNTALVVATGKTSCTELIKSEGPQQEDDYNVFKAAISLLLNEPILDTRVLDIHARYIVVNGVIIELNEHTIHRVDSDQ